MKEKSRHSFWKIVAIVFIALFALFILHGAWRFYHFKSSFTPASPEEKDVARLIVENDLKGQQLDPVNFEIRVDERVKKDAEATLIRVSAWNNTTRHSYIIDAQTKEILMRSATTESERMKEMRTHKKRGKMFYGGPPR